MPCAEVNKASSVLCIAIWLTVLLVANQSARGERLPIKVYTTADGLVHDHINRIVRDSRGFLWLCTSEGLSRFDGYKFTNYGTDQGLPNRQVNDFLEMRNGEYWVATPGGLCRFNPLAEVHQPRFIVHRLGDDHASQIAYALAEDRDGTLWCGTESSLYRLIERNGEWASYAVDLGWPTRYGSADAFALVADQRGGLWILSASGLYRHRTDGIVERYAAQEGISVTDNALLFGDHLGKIWLGTSAGLYQLVADPQPGRSIVARLYTTKDGMGASGVSCMYQSSDERLWIGTWNGLNEFLPPAGRNGPQFRTYSSANGIRDVTALSEDRDGNLWMGTGTNGAMKIAANGFTTYTEADGLHELRIAQISEDREGEICVFSGVIGKGHINRFDGRAFIPAQVTLPAGVQIASWGWYQNMLQDHLGDWWMSTFQGLVRYPKPASLERLTRTQPKAIYTTRDGLGGDSLFRLFEDSRGDLWIGTIDMERNTLDRWERSTGTFHQYSPKDGIPFAAPTAFCEDNSGSLWIGFYAGGVTRYREGRFTFYSVDDGLPAGFINAIYLDREDRLWVATSEGGVARLDEPGADRPRFVTFTTADGLSSNHATCLTEDQWGRIYIGTGRGVDELDPSTGHVRHYTTADGLANNNVNVSFRDRSGALWFGTLDGLSRLIPAPIRREPPPSILIGALRIAGVQQPLSELGETSLSGFDLEANQNQLQLDFFGLSFATGETLRYQYKLEGADREWSPLSDQRSVNFANLKPGGYRFMVRAVTAEGLASESPAVVVFSILPPYWQRWWFIAIVATLLGLAAYSLYRYRVARLVELERVRTRIATDLHDDIGSSLSQVSVLSEVIRRRVATEPSVSEPLSMIANLSRDVVDSMNDIVWAINPRRDHLNDLTQRMRRFASDVFTAREIEFTFTAPDPRQNMRVGADMRREVFLIFKESVNNMIRHSASTKAVIDFSIEDAWLYLKMADNGRGFAPDRDADGNGLLSMRERASRIGGTLDISSNDGRGTVVRLKAPLRRVGWIRR